MVLTVDRAALAKLGAAWIVVAGCRSRSEAEKSAELLAQVSPPEFRAAVDAGRVCGQLAGSR